MPAGRSIKLGFLTDWLDPGYHRAILRGTFQAARERDARLVCFLGRLHADDGSWTQTRPVYDLIGSESLDGLVVMGGDLAALNHAEQLRFVEQFRPLPICLVARELDGVSSVLVDNGAGMQSVVNHLVRVHGHARFAFVRGTPGNAEAEQRLGVFQSTLQENGLAANPDWIVTGDFTVGAGERAVRTLLDERRLSLEDIDAVVCSNDAMAFGFIEALERRGVRVPAGVAVVGFDDVPEARYARVPLSTVRQPLDEQGREAVRLLLAEIHGSSPGRALLRTEFVPRRTCGCFSTAAVPLVREPSPTRFGFDAALVERRQLILAELARAAQGALGALGSSWEPRLLNAFTEEMKGHKPDSFREAMDDMLRRVIDGGGEANVCHEVVSALWRALVPCTINDPAARSSVESMLDEARLAIASTTERVQAALRFKIDRWGTAVAETAAALYASSSMQSMAEVLERSLPQLGIPRLDLVLYEGEGPSRVAMRVLTVVAGRARLERTQVQLKALPQLMMPEADLRGLYLTALSFESEVLGFLGMALGAQSEFVYQALRQALSAAITTMRLRERQRPSVPPSIGRKG